MKDNSLTIEHKKINITRKQKIVIAVGLILLAIAGLTVGLVFGLRTTMTPLSDTTQISFPDGSKMAMSEF